MQNIRKTQIKYMQDPNGVRAKECFINFIKEFHQNINGNKVYTYQIEIDNMINNERKTFVVDVNDLISHDSRLHSYIVQNYYKMQQYLNQAVQEYIFSITKVDNKNKIYTISFKSAQEISVRDLKTKEVGKLQSIYGTVTRTGQVYPELYKGTFECPLSKYKAQYIEQQFKYTEPTICQCEGKHKWTLLPKESVFCDFQKVKLQEDSSEIPAGSMPRSIDIILRNELCETVKPGDKCRFIGTLLVVPDVASLSKVGEIYRLEKKQDRVYTQSSVGAQGVTGLAQSGQRDINYKMVFQCCGVELSDSRFNELQNEQAWAASLEKPDLEMINKMRNSDNLIKTFSDSICPSIYGHSNIKKGILLQLLGGVNKKTQNGITLRGDINTCIVGDPSTAKSQFLKYVNNFLPRSVYTSGKASTSAGLTASVVRDPETNEMCIEAGALMLADNGICCIDEFDKMDEKDQVAIHEAMEQQTISIAKAGIHATLNARASILAAANPVFGRYDKSKSLRFNLQMSAPLMSRFDLFFVVLDNSSEVQDRQIANYILSQHRNVLTDTQQTAFTKEQLQLYIKYARAQFKPTLSKSAAELIQKKYVQMRMKDVSQQSSYKMTVRQLESLLRLSEAISRLHLSDEIQVADVEEASMILQSSILKIEKPDIEYTENDLRALERNSETIEREGELEKKDPKEFRITYDQYETIAQVIVNFVQSEIKKQMIEAAKAEKPSDSNIIGVQQSEISEKYVE